VNTATVIDKAKARITALYERNIEFFKNNIPQVYETVCANTDTVKLVIDPATGRLEENPSDSSVYNGDALNFAIKEVNSFYESMEMRDYRPNPQLLVLSHLILKRPFIETANLYAKDYLLTPAKRPAYKDLVIFGSGLGYHIEILCNRKDFSHYTVIEKDVEIFKRSLYTIDWHGVLTNLGIDRKITFLIYDPSRPEKEFLNSVQGHLTYLFPANSVSTLTYSHAYGKNEELYKKLKEKIFDYNIYARVAFERLGPDAQRLMNANENCKQKTPAIHLDQSKIENIDTPIAIVGAGPSLDIYIEILKKHQEKFIIVSCGSALASLMKAGVKPQYHFELEFLNIATDLISHTNNQFDLGDIELLCSYEGNPRYKEYFKETRVFVQATTEIVNYISLEYVLFYGGLTCTNGAAALMTRLCDNDIYFFGMDFAHTHGEHHAKDNITNETDLPDNLDEFELVSTELKKDTGLWTKDTKGNDVMTTPALNSARQLIEEMCGNSKNEYFNCSDGADIKHSEYISKEDLDNKLKKIKQPAERIKFVTNVFDSEQIHTVTKNILQVSFDVCDQILDIAKTLHEYDKYEACLRVVKLVESIKKETNIQSNSRYGQYRSIMSFNRQPLLLLFSIINYGSEEHIETLVEQWIKDYIAFVENARQELMPRFENKNFLVTEEWLDTYSENAVKESTTKKGSDKSNTEFDSQEDTTL